MIPVSSRSGLFSLGGIEFRGGDWRRAALCCFAGGNREVTGGKRCGIAPCLIRRRNWFHRCLLFRKRPFEHCDAALGFDTLDLGARLRHLTMNHCEFHSRSHLEVTRPAQVAGCTMCGSDRFHCLISWRINSAYDAVLPSCGLVCIKIRAAPPAETTPALFGAC